MTAPREPIAPHLPLATGAEFDLIRRMLVRWGSAARGVGDDAAELRVPAGERLVVSTDTSVENVHFREAWLTPEEIGYRACAAALSDLAAMAARPLGVVIAMTLPDRWRHSLEQLAEGLGEAARACDAPIVGGDLVRGTELSLTITVLGSASNILRRSGAKPGDTLYVTGRFGGPGLALSAWEQARDPEPEHRQRFAHPVPRLREAVWLAAHGASAAIDCSDGLAADAAHLAAASGVLLSLDIDQVPRMSPATVLEVAESGEEYELLLSAPAALDTVAFEQTFAVLLTAVGRVDRAGPGAGGAAAIGHDAGVVLRNQGRELSPARGFDHFSA